MRHDKRMQRREKEEGEEFSVKASPSALMKAIKFKRCILSPLSNVKKD